MPSSGEKIYKSPFGYFDVSKRSIFSHVLSPPQGHMYDYGSQSEKWAAFIDAPTGTTITRGALKDLGLRLAYGLRHNDSLRLKRGDTVMIFAPNCLAWPVVLLGGVAAGLKLTLANTSYTPRELLHQFGSSGARAVITTQDLLPIVNEMISMRPASEKNTPVPLVLIPDTFEWIQGERDRSVPAKGMIPLSALFVPGKKLEKEEPFDGNEANQTVFLCYSSGTTGNPKGVETTHLNLTSLMDSINNSWRTYGKMVPNKDVMLGILPFYHIYGLVKLLLFPLTLGIATVVQRKFEPVEFCRNVEKYRITISLIVPPVLVVLARDKVVDEYDMSSLRILFSGAAPLSSTLTLAVRKRFPPPPKSNLSIIQGYGLTETSPTTHMMEPETWEKKLGSIGRLLGNLEARLVDLDDQDVEIGQPGELWLRGPTIMKGYYNNPSATSASITPDRWFKTGDVAIRDKEGYYYIVDRRKELIKYKGFQVPPAELEGILLTHPDVADAAVIGVYDEVEATELPRAYLVHAKGAQFVNSASPKEKEQFALGVITWMESKVARHKFLRGGVVILDVIPKSPAGKILRKNLRETAKQEGVTGGKVYGGIKAAKAKAKL